MKAASPASVSPFHTLAFGEASPSDVVAHARLMLSHYTDIADLHADMEAGVDGFIVLDARSREAYARSHIPGAINFPHREMDAESVKRLARHQLIVTYCDGNGCNGSTKAALKLASFGFRVKELLGGLDWWIRDGHKVEQGTQSAPACGC